MVVKFESLLRIWQTFILAPCAEPVQRLQPNNLILNANLKNKPLYRQGDFLSDTHIAELRKIEVEQRDISAILSIQFIHEVLDHLQSILLVQVVY